MRANTRKVLKSAGVEETSSTNTPSWNFWAVLQRTSENRPSSPRLGQWAIRDSKNLKLSSKTWIGLLPSSSKLMSRMIPMSAETWLPAKVESIVDLSTLSIMKQTCRGPSRSWATAARNHSEYLSSVGSVVERNDRIRDWDAQIESVKSDSQIMNLDERRRKRRRYEPLSPSRSTTRSMRRDSPPIRISRFSMLSFSTYGNGLMILRWPTP